MRFFLLGNANKPQVHDAAAQIRKIMRQFGDVVLEDFLQSRDLTCEKADVALVLGGDGAILRAVRQMGYCQTPVLGVNLGHLGFLADLSPDEVAAALPQVVAGQYSKTRHLMFECRVEGPGGVGCFLGLNEVVLHTGPPFSMVDLEVTVGGQSVIRMVGDGLILSTPVGSTAHGLSAGGPILSQELDVFVVTPVCAHALTHRPLVESAGKEFTIHIRRGASVWLTVDGQENLRLTPEQRVVVKKAPVTFELIKVAGRTYYQLLREKLNWGEPPNYRPQEAERP